MHILSLEGTYCLCSKILWGFRLSKNQTTIDPLWLYLPSVSKQSLNKMEMKAQVKNYNLQCGLGKNILPVVLLKK